MNRIESYSYFLLLQRIHTYFNIIEGTSTHIQSLKYSSYLTTLTMLMLISTLHNSAYKRESQNEYESRTNTQILDRRLCVCSVCCSRLFCLYMFDVNVVRILIATCTYKSTYCSEYE